jgi:hypothetical protein
MNLFPARDNEIIPAGVNEMQKLMWMKGYLHYSKLADYISVL